MLSAHLDEMHLVKVTRRDRVGAYRARVLDAPAGRLVTFRLQTADSRLQTPDFRLQTSLLSSDSTFLV